MITGKIELFVCVIIFSYEQGMRDFFDSRRNSAQLPALISQDRSNAPE